MNAKVENDQDFVTLEVDGVEMRARKGAMLIEATDQADIHVPRFCYHRKLSIAANCRMCLVDVEKAPKPLPACATPVAEGMKVRTRSERALKAQKGVMEFLLINHPLDCPICDQGGECELQDLAMGYGRGVSRFSERKRVVKDENLGPLISTEMTRCIHCTRCVRFLDEVAGQPELGGMGRGEHMEISTLVGHGVNSEMSGNIIDLCPVGALTSKPYRFTARAWEMLSHPAVSPHDCVGSNLQIHHLNGQIKRVVPRENESVNECWISDRDRFAYQGLYAEDRLTSPMIKRDGQWHSVDWETALEEASSRLRAVAEEHGAEQLGALLSPSATSEEMYLLGRLMRGMGSHNVDARLQTGDFSDQADRATFPGMGVPLADIDRLDAVLLVGSNPRHDHPIVNHRLRKAALAGARVHVLYPRQLDLNYSVAGQHQVSPEEMVSELALVAKALLESKGTEPPKGLHDLIGDVVLEQRHRELATMLAEAGNAALMLGPLVESHPGGGAIRQLAHLIVELAAARICVLTEGANQAGAWLLGAVPHREVGGAASEQVGLDARAMLEQPRRGYLLLGLEPEHDCWDGAAALEAMNQAHTVVAMTGYVTDSMREYADVLLPIGLFGESSGSYVSAEGRWQSFPGVAMPVGEARPAWKVLRVLGNLLKLDGFDYNAPDEVAEEARRRCGEPEVRMEQAWVAPQQETSSAAALMRVGTAGLYSGDPLVRRAAALQQTVQAETAGQVRVAASVAEELGVSDGDSLQVQQGASVNTMVVRVDDTLANGVVWVSRGAAAAAGLGAAVGPVTLARV
ncbi:NADH-quinone oxidoreductase subunit G [Natronocella acetinitrilica]|uniref:NADH-quinone oxidoreductase n=1 Tax=Natronocella acetinitrilica TaxID=414046 RepID=A0AAE3KAS8_9GAMM|nr:NADH-quinone oxidoreductase subunit NuoG [Natronocella acetinitrilica]MCP1674735.1 NADH-quinone oxidoreductase subunit G [Natronocella acetinitrilica]